MNRALVAALAAGFLCIASSANAAGFLSSILMGGGDYGCGCDAAPVCGCDNACGHDRCHRERSCRQPRERCCRQSWFHRDHCGCDNSCAKAAPTCEAVAPTCEAMAPTCEAKMSCGCDNGCGRQRCHREKCCRQPRERCCRQPRERCHHDRGCNNTCGYEKMAAPSCGCGY